MLSGYGNPLTAYFGSGAKAAGPLFAMRAYARGLLKDTTAAVLLLKPGESAPVDMRGPKVVADDRKLWLKARDALWDSGIELPEVRPEGLHLATRDPEELASWVTRYRDTYGSSAPINFGLEVGRSGFIVVDVDTVAQTNTFRAHWAHHAAINSDAELAAFTATWPAAFRSLPPDELPSAVSDAQATVLTPGKFRDDKWIHRHGGHFYFLPPEGLQLHTSLPTAAVERLADLGITAEHPLYRTIEIVSDPSPGDIKVRGKDVPTTFSGERVPGRKTPVAPEETHHEAGYSVFWRSRYLVIPPSVRPEGEYKVGSDVRQCPVWLADRIAQKIADARDAVAARASKTRRPRPAPAAAPTPTDGFADVLPDRDTVISAADPRMRWLLENPPRPLLKAHLDGWKFSRSEAVVVAAAVAGPGAARRLMSKLDASVDGSALFDVLKTVAVTAGPNPFTAGAETQRQAAPPPPVVDPSNPFAATAAAYHRQRRVV